MVVCGDDWRVLVGMRDIHTYIHTYVIPKTILQRTKKQDISSTPISRSIYCSDCLRVDILAMIPIYQSPNTQRNKQPTKNQRSRTIIGYSSTLLAKQPIHPPTLTSSTVFSPILGPHVHRPFTQENPLILPNPSPNYPGAIHGSVCQILNLTLPPKPLATQTTALCTSVAAAPSLPFPFSTLICSTFSSPARPISAANVLCGTHLALVLGFVSSNILSTCSKLKPFVSGTKK